MYKNVYKRILDIVLSLGALVILLPILLIISAMIWITSGKPVIFGQDRIGKNANVFRMYKFRTMIKDSEFTETGVYSSWEDPRVTKFGRFLRKTSLDELPQLLNILKGEMSFIGPRPPLTYHPWPVQEYTSLQKRMFEVRPGITGWAQVNGRKQVQWDQRIKLNIWYVDHMSFSLDCRIIYLTVATILNAEDNVNSEPTV